MKLRSSHLLFFIQTMAAFCSIGCTEPPPGPVVDPLPSTADIQSIKASYITRTGGIGFDVAPEHWRTILAALQPARSDPHPAKWVVFGSLKITLKDGRPFLVDLYEPASEPGAFSAGETWEKRTYYRGGSFSKLETALREAYESSEKKASPAGAGHPG